MIYEINLNQLGNDQHSKAYSLKDKNSGRKLIVKIYEESRFCYYNNEQTILKLLNDAYLIQNGFFAMYKDINYNNNMFEIPKEVKGKNNKFLFYDYLSKLSLLDYINYNNNKISEVLIKLLCYNLLKSIEKLHLIDISHNKINFSNIMFDDDFNPKIIHFSESYNINDKIKYNTDLFSLGQILAQIMSLGKFNSINYNKKTKEFIIFGFIQNKKIHMEESKFWYLLKTLHNIDISKEFLNFFHIIINAKKSKEILSINDLLKNEWLKDIYDDINIVENNFKEYFKETYKLIIEENIKESSIEIDIKNLIEEDKKEIIIKNDELIKKEDIFESNFGNSLVMNSLKKLEEEKRKKEEFEQIIEEEKKRIEGGEEKKKKGEDLKKEKEYLKKKVKEEENPKKTFIYK